MENIINKTTKRLLSASRLGINFDYGDGHRWIQFYEDEVTDNGTMHQELQKNKIYPNCKVYGNIIDCLNFVDFLLKKMNMPTLEEQFDKFNDWGFDDEFVGEHTPWEESGTETKEYFEGKIKT
jgi:hypothetical protein